MVLRLAETKSLLDENMSLWGFRAFFSRSSTVVYLLFIRKRKIDLASFFLWLFRSIGVFGVAILNSIRIISTATVIRSTTPRKMAKRESSAANEQAEDCESAAAGSSKENNPSDAQKKDAEHAECAPPEKRRKTIESKEAADTIKSNNGVSQDNKTECQDSGSGASGSAIAAVKEEIKVKEENSDDSSSSWDELANEIVDESAANDVKSEPKEELPDDEPLPDLKRITSFKTLGPHIAKQKNHLNYLYMADVPQICKDEPCMLGIDEAGRGPVLGKQNALF